MGFYNTAFVSQFLIMLDISRVAEIPDQVILVIQILYFDNLPCGLSFGLFKSIFYPKGDSED